MLSSENVIRKLLSSDKTLQLSFSRLYQITSCEVGLGYAIIVNVNNTESFGALDNVVVGRENGDALGTPVKKTSIW